MKKKQPIKKDKSLEIKLLAKRIKQLRIEQGFKGYEYFAYEKNISRSQYGRYEKGEDIRFSSLIKLIDAFGISPVDFFSEGFEDLKKTKKREK